ncbi:protein of unknown function [Methylocaldum szegediense]|uniref:Secreted protein n=1 Tax=Methylocaldum szegediense TaxID=73780 RepID=A0ABN8WW15_9GAMM|nr:protein of unknown function [Methylocaldum szegediense]
MTAVWILTAAPAISDGGSARDEAVVQCCGMVLVFAMFCRETVVRSLFRGLFSRHKFVSIVSIETHYAKREKRLFPRCSQKW